MNVDPSNAQPAVALNPVTAARIEEFGRRRRRLIVERGIFAAVAAWFGALVIVAAADGLFLLEDGIRYLLSALAYGLAGFVLWRVCLRHLSRRADHRVLARWLEATRPDLREDLLSAVELGEPASADRWDSPVFRARLQDDIARRVEGLDVREILPFRLIARWARVAGVSIVLMLLLAFVPGLQWRRLLARALLPSANIERVSKTRIVVVDPTPADAVVPRGDTVPVVVEVSGRPASEIHLETFAGGARASVRMKPIGPARFTANVDVGTDTLQYRIRGGDALTRRYRITAYPAPQVVAFHKTYRVPDYAKMEPRTVHETAGDLEGLEGTRVELKLDVDQPVRAAELRIENGAQATTVPLQKAEDGSLRTDLTLEKPGTYHVRLVAERTGFENRYRPVYEIRVLPDLVPQVELKTPERDVTVTPDEVVGLAAVARDDFGIASLVQSVQVNRSAWRDEGAPAVATNAEVSVERSWDLMPMGLKPGDQVLVKFVATDLKGNIGESTVRRLTIGARGFDPERMKSIEARKALRESTEKLSDAAKAAKKTNDESRDALRNPERDAQAARQAQVKVAAAVQATDHAAEAVRDALQKAMETTPKGAPARELSDVARALSRTQRSDLDVARQMLDAQRDATPENAREFEEDMKRRLERASSNAAEMDRAVAKMLAAEESEMAVRDLAELAREHQRMAEVAARPEGAPPPEQMARRQAVAVGHLDQVAATLRDTAELSKRGDLKEMAGRMEKKAAEAREQMGGAEDPTKPMPPDALRQPVQDALNQAVPIAAQLRREADEFRRRLNTEHDARQPLSDLQNTLGELSRSGKQPEGRQERLVAKASALRDAAADQMKDAAAIEERRADADAAFMKDATTAAAALRHVRPEDATPETARAMAEGVKDLAKAVAKLETGHDLQAAARAAETMAAEERWDRPETASGRERQREWDNLRQDMPAIEREMRSQQFPNEAADSVAKANNGPDAARVAEEMNRRRDQNRGEQSVAGQLAAVGTELAEAARKAQPALQEAREALAAMAPSLAEQLADAHGDAAKLRKQSEDLASDRDKPADAARDEVRSELAAQQRLNEAVDDIRQALRADAAAQDMAAAEGRERARDADDGLAMLREPPPKAEDLLRTAAAAREAAQRASALEQAAAQQGRLEKSLDTLAKHYAQMEQGSPEGLRADLRAQEAEAGLQTALDQEYGEAGRMAEMAQGDSPQSMAGLEQELASNPAMQAALDRLARESLDRAASDLNRAAQGEKTLAERAQALQDLTGRRGAGLARPAAAIAKQARELAQGKVQSAARQASQAAPSAEQPLKAAGESLEQAAASVPRNFEAGRETLANAMENTSRQLREAAQASADASGQASKTAGEAQTAADQAGQKAAQGQAAGDPNAADQARQAQAAAQGQQKAAQGVAGEAQSAHEAAKQLADAASAVSSELRQMAGNERGALQQAAGQQSPLTSSADQSGADIARAGRHESRLGRNMGEALQQAGERTQETAAGEMTDAGRQLQSQPTAEAAAPSVQQASGEVGRRAEELAGLMSQMPAMPAASAAEAAAQWMARALDQMDAQQAAASAQQASAAQQAAQAQAQQAAQSAMSQAAQAQAASMSQSRARGEVPGTQPKDGAPAHVAGRAGPEGVPAPAVAVPEDWAKLPAQMARDLMEAKRENVPEEYRAMVEVYFKAVATDAQKANP